MIDLEWRANQYDDSDSLPIAPASRDRLLMEESPIGPSSPEGVKN